MLKTNIFQKISSYLPLKKVEDKKLTLASGFWNNWQQNRDTSQRKWVDWGDHPKLLELIYSDLFGSGNTTLFDFLKVEYPQFANSNAFSLCSGDGSFEKKLISSDVFGSITGIDIAEKRVIDANYNRGGYKDRLQFIVGDVNEGKFGHKLYDVVFAKAALHHVEKLDLLMEGIKSCLKASGYLVTIDFFGPKRFQWSDYQIEAANRFLSNEIPTELLVRPDGSIHQHISRPTIEQMIQMDPSEAVRSNELFRLISGNFRQLRVFDIGGTLLNLIFDESIINNFDEDNEGHNEILRKAFFLEKALIEEGRIDCDFKFIIAQL